MKLKAYLSAHNIIQQQAAQALGISQPHVNALCNGDRKPSAILAAKIEIWSGGQVRVIDFI